MFGCGVFLWIWVLVSLHKRLDLTQKVYSRMFPEVREEQFDEWHRLELKAMKTMYWGACISVVAQVIFSIVAWATGDATLLWGALASILVFVVAGLAAAVPGIKANGLRKKLNIDWRP